MSLNNISKVNDIFLKEFLKEFYRQIIRIEDYRKFENILSGWIEGFSKYNKNLKSKIILKFMESHEENENWFSSLIGFFYQHGIGGIIDKNKSLELYLLSINKEELVSVYQIINIIIAKYLLSLYYYKDIILDKREFEDSENVHVNSQNQFESFNDELKINLCKDEINNIEKYFESLEELNNLGFCYQHGIRKKKDEFKAFECYLKSAEGGNLSAQNNLGYCYQNGIGIEKDKKEAFNWYLKAANKGDVYAQYNLGICYQTGIGINKNDKRAFELYFKSAEGGYSFAQNRLDYYYQNGIGMFEDESKAKKSDDQEYLDAGTDVNIVNITEFELYKIAAEKGDKVAQYSLGNMYQNGKGTEKSGVKAFEYYKKSADQAYLKAQFQLGYCYDVGIGSDVNKTKAFKLYEIAAEKGHNMAQYNIGRYYELGIGVGKDEAKALEYYKKSADQEYLDAGTDVNTTEFELYKIAAEKGDKVAQYNLGILYQKGEGTEKDEAKAFEYCKKSAEQKCLNAQLQLGYCYLFGIGTEVNGEKAFDLFIMGAGKEHGESQNNLGCLYAKERNLEKAIYWYTKAVQNGSKNAYINLGVHYELGIGVNKDKIKAFNMYEKSVKSGSVYAKFHLGYCYVNGIGTKINKKKGFELYSEAAGEKDNNIFELLLYEIDEGILNDLDEVRYHKADVSLYNMN